MVLSLQYLATFSLIFAAGSRVLEPLGLDIFTSTKYSMSTLCFSLDNYGKGQDGLLEKRIALPFLSYLHLLHLPVFFLHKERYHQNMQEYQKYFVRTQVIMGICCESLLGKVVL